MSGKCIIMSDIVLRLVSVINMILLSSRPFSLQGRAPLYDFIKKRLTLVCIVTFTDRCLSNFLAVIVEITKLYILISVWVTLPSFKVTVV